ncbi:MAG: NifU family protein [Halobacteria archaeon]
MSSKINDSGDFIDVTEDAVNMIEGLVEDRGLEGYGIRLEVSYRGPEASYTLEFSDSPEQSDMVTEAEGIKFYIDGESAAAVEGSVVDYVMEGGRSGFKIMDPVEAGDEDEDYDFDDTLEGRIHRYLAKNFPQIQAHGGEAVIEEIDESRGYVKLSLEGACSGCGISDSTTRAIKNNMPDSVDGIDEVETDAGESGDGHMQIEDPPF